MRLLFVADGRSPISLNWIRYFADSGHEVHLASTFACEPGLPLASLQVVPAAFSSAKKTGARPGSGQAHSSLWGASAVGLRTKVRQWLGPLTLPRAARRLSGIIEQVRPDLVHAMRIPYEGMLAGMAVPRSGPPLLISIWGNDFTLHAPSTPLMASYTRLALESASALHADCHRDVRLARAWGFPAGRPSVVLPGAGGIQMDLFSEPAVEAAAGSAPVILNPRGFRAYVRSDTFFRSLPQIIERYPALCVLCTAMAGEPQAEQWVQQLGLRANVRLLPHQSRAEMAALFRQAQVTVSPSTHDGTPNTLLEAMASGSFPVVGDLESLREWITPGVNGLLVDSGDPQALSRAMLQALEQPELRGRASQINRRLVAERAAYDRVMPRAEGFYRQLISAG